MGGMVWSLRAITKRVGVFTASMARVLR